MASTISHRRLQSLLGLMSFVTACIRPGRIFMSALLNGFCGLPRHGFLTICDDVRANQQWWLCFLVKFNGVSIVPSPVCQPDVLITDLVLLLQGVTSGISVSKPTFHSISWTTMIITSMLRNCWLSLLPCISGAPN